MKLKLNTTKTQNMTCDELEDFTQAYIGGVRTSLDEPIGGNDAPYPLDEDKEIPNINITDGVYADTKERLEEEDITVNLASSAKEYVRILDDAVREILLANVTHAAEGKISIDEAKAPLAIEGNYGGSPQKFAGTNVEDLDCLEYFNMYVATGSTELVNAFQNCAKLKSIRLPYNVLTISGSHGFCFSGCSSLEEIYMNNVTKLGSYVFQNTKIKKIYIRSVESFLNIGDGGYYNASSRPTVGGVASLYLDSDHNTPLGTPTNPLTIPKTITQINSYALYNLKSLTNLQMHSGVTSIGDYAFYGCSGLDGTTLKSILENNTSAQTKLIGTFGETNISGDITIPSNITDIGPNTFNKCNNITSITANSVKTIGSNYAFSNCENITTVTFSDALTSMGNWTFSDCTKLKTANLGNSITYIGDSSFSNCSELENINIPSTVKTIYVSAFSNCKKLKNVDLSNVEYIKSYAFNNCTSLTSVDLSNVTSIGQQAFQDCSSLVISELSTELNKVEAIAFRGVTFVDGFKIPDSLTDLSIYWNNSWAFTSSKGYLHLNKVQKLDFSGGTNGDVCIIPNTVVEFTVSNILGRNGGFGGTVCEIKNLIWQDGGTDIIINNKDEGGAILNYYTTNLFFIDLPSVLTINNSSYLNGVPRKYNVIRMSIPPVISTDDQQGINATHTIFVYQSSLSAYQSATCWKNYNIKAIGGTEWVTAMKDLYLQHEGKCYNRCTNITDDGYTSSYDNKYYAWTDAFVDYDIFGVDRIEL